MSSPAQMAAVRSVVLVLQSVAVGGMEAHVRYLARELRRRYIAVAVVVPESSEFDELAGFVRSEGSEVLRLDTDARQGRGRQVRAAVRLVRILRRRRADALHLHTGGATGGLFVAAAARLASRATVVVTEHDVPGERPAALKPDAVRGSPRARQVRDAASHSDEMPPLAVG